MNSTRRLFFIILFVALGIAGYIVSLAPPVPEEEGAGGDGTGTGKPAVGQALVVEVASSSTKQAWMERAAADFAASGARSSDGRPIQVRVKSVSSGGSTTAILEGKLKPTAWSPGSGSWVAELEQQWRQQHGRSLMGQSCRSTIYTPLGIAMWRPMAEVLGWPDKPIGWHTLVELAQDPQGWERYGRKDWGKFRLGHAHPRYGNSGLLTVTSFVYGMLGKTDGLTAAEVYDPKVEKGLRSMAQSTAKYGVVTEDLVDLMVKQGPGYLHAIATYESDTLRMNLEQQDQLRFPVAFIFPADGTFWGEHPYCVLDQADWVTPEQADAARRFHAYLQERERQELAIDYLLRPLDPAIPLRSPLDLAHGTDPRVTPASVKPLGEPGGDITAAVIDLFTITKRKATVLLALDVSGSMQGEKIRTATEATVEFLHRLQPEDQVGVLLFNHNVTTLAEPKPVREVVESLAGQIATLIADGNTALNRAVCTAADTMQRRREADQAAGESRLYGIILLSDGEDTVGAPSANQMFATCLPANAEVDGTKIFPIAFGSGANTEVLQRISNVSGGRMFTAEPDSIAKIYLRISAEQ
jgi:Ca-activated chloride channel homolog